MTDPADDPIAMLIADRDRARVAGDPLVDVCYLATVAARPGAAPGRAEVRALSLRDITAEGVGILINRTSPKWRQLEASAHATLLIHWPLIGRQYRLHYRRRFRRSTAGWDVDVLVP
jgi:pyridoxine/pyridoxamine 5'-phosphate oxidase